MAGGVARVGGEGGKGEDGEEEGNGGKEHSEGVHGSEWSGNSVPLRKRGSRPADTLASDERIGDLAMGCCRMAPSLAHPMEFVRFPGWPTGKTEYQTRLCLSILG